jgi:hypothetical protein
MNDEKFSSIVLTHQSAIYAGRWRRTEYSVTVRYKATRSIRIRGRGTPERYRQGAAS